MIDLVWLVPLLPLIGFLINGLGFKVIPKSIAGMLGSATVIGSFLISLMMFNTLLGSDVKSFTIHLFNWFSVGDLSVSLSFLYDPLSALMILIISGIGSLIHIYSIGYMSHDQGYGKFFAYLNLFVFFMLLLVLGSNFLVMFIGWEGVGLCSYLLIGFWFKNQSYASAAKKAFVMNRIGDLGFLLGIFLLFNTFGSVEYSVVFSSLKDFASGNPVLTTITLLLFIGACGKSAQIPLHTWLPDAMAGPTPVSALIHAATMVTAGIYMIARSNALFDLTPMTMQIIAGVGLATAALGALIAITQTDIKKVLAYSTVSQLGYMFLALGVGAYSAGVFHLMTHAFFKALLFLGAGSVIHAMSNEQDMRNMGGLKKKLPTTYLTMLIGTMAISGIPPFSGFFSKDEILAHVFEFSPVMWAIAVTIAFCTAFYMFRLIFLTFFNQFRGTEHQQSHLHESPLSMTLPLIILAVLSFAGGFLNVPELFGGNHALSSFLNPVLNTELNPISLSHETEYVLMAVSVVGVIVSIAIAWFLYVKKHSLPAKDVEQESALSKISFHKFYMDELYALIITRPLRAFSVTLFEFVDKAGIDGLVNGAGKSVVFGGKYIRYIQNGSIGFYILMMVIGVAALFIFSFIQF